MSEPVIVLGAGPAGLAAAACLKRRGVEPLVLEAGPSVASSWRRHYARLRLHTVKQQSHLPGMPFPRELPRYPARADVVAYLEAYAARFEIAPRAGETATRVRADGEGLVVETARGAYAARAVVVATGQNRVPNADALADQARFAGTLVHASSYVDGAPFAGKRVLVVGAGNTGAELALDLLEHGARPTLAVRSPVNVVPRDFLGMPTQLTSIRLLSRLPRAVADLIGRLVGWLAFGNLARLGFGRPALGPLSAIERRGRIPILDVGTIAAVKRGAIAVRAGVARLTEGGAVFVDGAEEAFDAVVLATGYRPGLEALVDVPGALDGGGLPRDPLGGGAHANLFFVGYRTVATGHLREIGREAEAVARILARSRV